MKQLFFIVFLLNYFTVFSQESEKEIDNLFWYEATCENGSEKAQIDFKNDNYNIYLTGLRFSDNSEEEFDKFYDNYMLGKYNIKFVEKGCVVTGSMKCYKETMGKLIYEKFGADIFERSRKEAKEKFEKK